MTQSKQTIATDAAPLRHRTVFPSRASRRLRLRVRPAAHGSRHHGTRRRRHRRGNRGRVENLGAVLKAAGADFSHVVRATVYLADMNDFAAVNEVYARYFGENAPARVAVEVARLPRDARVEIDAIAYVG